MYRFLSNRRVSVILLAMPLLFAQCNPERSSALSVSYSADVDEANETLFKVRWYLDRFLPFGDSSVVFINKGRALKYNIYTGQLEAQFTPSAKNLDSLRKINRPPQGNIKFLPIIKGKSLMRIYSNFEFMPLTDTTFCGIVPLVNPYKTKALNTFETLGNKDSIWVSVTSYCAYLITFNQQFQSVNFTMIGEQKNIVSKLLKKPTKINPHYTISSGFYLLDEILYLNQIIPMQYANSDTFNTGIYKLKKDSNHIFSQPQLKVIDVPHKKNKTNITKGAHVTSFYFRKADENLYCFNNKGLYRIATGKNILKGVSLLTKKYFILKDVFFVGSDNKYWLYIAKAKANKPEIILKNILLYIVDGKIEEKLLLSPPNNHKIKMCRITQNKCITLAYAPDKEKYYFEIYNYNFTE